MQWSISCLVEVYGDSIKSVMGKETSLFVLLALQANMTSLISFLTSLAMEHQWRMRTGTHPSSCFFLKLNVIETVWSIWTQLIPCSVLILQPCLFRNTHRWMSTWMCIACIVDWRCTYYVYLFIVLQYSGCVRVLELLLWLLSRYNSVCSGTNLSSTHLYVNNNYIVQFSTWW